MCASRCLHILSVFFRKDLEIFGNSRKTGTITICANTETTREKIVTKPATSRENFETFTATPYRYRAIDKARNNCRTVE